MTSPAFNVLAVCGSLRSESLNRTFLQAMGMLAPPDLHYRLWQQILLTANRTSG